MSGRETRFQVLPKTFRLDVQGSHKNLAHFCTPHSFIKILTNLRTFFTVRTRRKFVTIAITKDSITPQLCRYTTLPILGPFCVLSVTRFLMKLFNTSRITVIKKLLQIFRF